MLVTHLSQFDTHAVIGGGQEQACEIEQTAEFFTVLSSTLYRDKKRAVVREVMCNAWDAHLMIDSQRPIEVTVTETEFVVQDFGPGIPHDRMHHTYCVYGRSTKLKSEKETGGFGLGCKAPWAVSDHFSVTSSAAGMRTIYTLSRGSTETEGKPGLLPIVSVPDDATGLRVAIPINEDERQEYCRLVRDIAKKGGIPVQLNGSPVPVQDFTEAFETGFCFQTNSNAMGPLETPISLRYGAVIYPVETSDPKLKVQIERLRDLLPADVRVVLMAKPNTVGVTPSRESLSFTEMTIKTVDKLIRNAMAQINAHVPAAYARLGSSIADKYGFSDHYDVERRGYALPEFGSSAYELAEALAKSQPASEQSWLRRGFKRGLVAKDYRRRREVRRGAIHRAQCRKLMKLAAAAGEEGSLFGVYAHGGHTEITLMSKRFSSIADEVLIAYSQMQAISMVRGQNCAVVRRHPVFIIKGKNLEERVARVAATLRAKKVLSVVGERPERAKPVRKPKAAPVLDTYPVARAFDLRGLASAGSIRFELSDETPFVTTPTNFIECRFVNGAYYPRIKDHLLSRKLGILPDTVLVNSAKQIEKLRAAGAISLDERIRKRAEDASKEPAFLLGYLLTGIKNGRGYKLYDERLADFALHDVACANLITDAGLRKTARNEHLLHFGELIMLSGTLQNHPEFLNHVRKFREKLNLTSHALVKRFETGVKVLSFQNIDEARQSMFDTLAFIKAHTLKKSKAKEA